MHYLTVLLGVLMGSATRGNGLKSMSFHIHVMTLRSSFTRVFTGQHNLVLVNYYYYYYYYRKKRFRWHNV